MAKRRRSGYGKATTVRRLSSRLQANHAIVEGIAAEEANLATQQQLDALAKSLSNASIEAQLVADALRSGAG